MLNKKILKLREELNNSIINGEDYEVVYKLSVKLDELITNYYKETIKQQNLSFLGSMLLLDKMFT